MLRYVYVYMLKRNLKQSTILYTDIYSKSLFSFPRISIRINSIVRSFVRSFHYNNAISPVKKRTGRAIGRLFLTCTACANDKTIVYYPLCCIIFITIIKNNAEVESSLQPFDIVPRNRVLRNCILFPYLSRGSAINTNRILFRFRNCS